jgi:hypothetical protein
MSYTELLGWQRYFREEPSNSIEIQLALLAQMVSSFGKGKHKLQDFLITQYVEKKNTTQEFASEDDVKAIFSLMAKQN